jgi:hypothetical protein
VIHRASIARPKQSEPVRSSPSTMLNGHFSPLASMGIQVGRVRDAEVVGSNPAAPTTKVLVRGLQVSFRPAPRSFHPAFIPRPNTGRPVRAYGQGWHALAGRVDQRSPDLVSTGPEYGSPIRPVSAVPRASRRVIRKTTRRCQPVREPGPAPGTNQPYAQAEGDSPTERSAHPNPSSLPVMRG